MKKYKVGLIGLGCIGVPIAHILSKENNVDLYIIADEQRRKKLQVSQWSINDEEFEPQLVLAESKVLINFDYVVVCVKNYHMKFLISLMKNVVSKNTVIIPLQNGIYSYDLLCSEFGESNVVKGFIQGPNTVIDGCTATYTNPGKIYMGSKYEQLNWKLKNFCEIFKHGQLEVTLHTNIDHMIWKKFMLNVACNNLTALTGADYSMFRSNEELRNVCKRAMNEFVEIAKSEGVQLCDDDVDDVMNYFLNYNGAKKTSMLVDVITKRKTENEFLAGDAIRLASKHGVAAITIRTLYELLKIKESIYLEKDDYI